MGVLTFDQVQTRGLKSGIEPKAATWVRNHDRMIFTLLATNFLLTVWSVSLLNQLCATPNE